MNLPLTLQLEAFVRRSLFYSAKENLMIKRTVSLLPNYLGLRDSFILGPLGHHDNPSISWVRQSSDLFVWKELDHFVQSKCLFHQCGTSSDSIERVTSSGLSVTKGLFLAPEPHDCFWRKILAGVVSYLHEEIHDYLITQSAIKYN